MNERRRLKRKDFSYYMQIVDNDTKMLIGHLVEIGSGGFRLDSQQPIPRNQDFRLRMGLTREVAEKPFIVFVARSKWCEVDPFDPFVYNVGFQLVGISPEDAEIFKRIIEKYGTEHKNKRIDLRRTNMW